MKKNLVFVGIACLVMLAFSFTVMAEDKAKKDEASEDDPYAEENAGDQIVGVEEVTLDQEIIRSRINQNIRGIITCYENALMTNQTLAGRVVVNFNIQVNGTVNDAKVVKNYKGRKTTLTDKKVQKCILERVNKITFPKREKGQPIEINYPFNFTPKG